MKMTILHKVENAMQGVQFIAQHIRDNDKDNEVLRTKKVKERGKDRDKDKDKDNDKDPGNIIETLIVCYIFEILMTQAFQI